MISKNKLVGCPLQTWISQCMLINSHDDLNPWLPTHMYSSSGMLLSPLGGWEVLKKGTTMSVMNPGRPQK